MILTNLISTWRGGQTWAYKATFAQTAGGGGALDVEIGYGLKGNEWELESITIGPDDYSGPEIVQADILDVDDDAVARLANTSLDNQRLSWPGLGEVIGTTNEAALRARHMISGTDKVFIQTGALANTETLTFTIRARLRGGIVPTVTFGGGGTPGTPTISYDEVI